MNSVEVQTQDPADTETSSAHESGISSTKNFEILASLLFKIKFH
jgi:hypothetical protein